MDLFVSALVIAALYAIHRRYPSERATRKRLEADYKANVRREVDAGFDLSARLGDLREYVRVSSKVMAAEALHRAPVSELPEAHGRGLDDAKEAITLAASRFGIPLPQMKVRFATLEGHAAHVKVHADGHWAVDLDHSLEGDREALLSVVAHEVAHVALLSRHIRLQPLERNEELTDTAAVLAGFGPVLLRTVLRESITELADGVEIQSRRLGYLPPRALVWLSTLRVEMAGGDALFYREHVDDWQRQGVDDYIRRRDEWRRLASQRRGGRVDCFACGTPMQLPAVPAALRVTCRTCAFRTFVPL